MAVAALSVTLVAHANRAVDPTDVTRHAAAEEKSRVIRVGPSRRVQTIAAAAAQARDGDLIEIDAGDYLADVAVWQQRRVTVRGVGGAVRLVAAGASAERKAIWVFRGGEMVVENIEFHGTRVSDRNGAGIRLERGRLVVKHCSFVDNENGILTSSDPTSELSIEFSEFGHNGAGDGQSHNLYVGAIRSLSVSGSYFHHARSGHLLKSRAAENRILFNRLTDESGGRASYELEFPNGGQALVYGNVIEQGRGTENPHLISYGVEGYRWPGNELILINNTLIDDRGNGGIFLRVSPGSVRVVALNNVFSGPGKIPVIPEAEWRGNLRLSRKEFVDADAYDFRLKGFANLAQRRAIPGMDETSRLPPAMAYRHPMQLQALPAGMQVPGAVQLQP